MSQNKFSINFAERLHGPNKEDGFYHSFVALMPIGSITGDFWQGAQKLHFDDDAFDRFMPNVREGTGRRWNQGLELVEYVQGDEKLLLPRWNHALAQAAEITGGRYVPFDVTRTNCLSGAIAASEAMGFEFKREFTKASVGAQPNDFPTLEPFEHDVDNPEHTDLETMRALNQSLVARLAK